MTKQSSQLELGAHAGPSEPTPGESPEEGRAEPANFEEAIRRLNNIVEQLEAGELPLEDSLKLFEEGVGLARSSQSRLDAAEKRVEELLSVDDHGRPLVRKLDVE